LTENTNTELIKKAQCGDLRAFEQLVQEHYTKIYNIALGLTGSPHDAEDAAQNVLIKLHNSIGSFKFQSKFSTWVYRITTNVCLDEARKKKRSKTSAMADMDDSLYETPSKDSSPEEHYISAEKRNALYKGISQLKKEHKQIIILRDINGFSYSEIAEITKCSEGTVKSRISRARSSLKDILTESGYFN